MGLDNTYAHFRGLSSSAGMSQSLLPQAIPTNKKGQKWKEGNMDRLEMIGLEQLRDNLHFRDFYKMVQGDLVYSDYVDDPEILRDIRKIRDEVELPTFVKHYDIIGIIINAIIGYYEERKDKFRIYSDDPISQGEYVEHKTKLVRDYVVEEFNIKLQRKLLEQGINPNQQEFKSEEEKQAYIQQIEATRQAMSPPEVELHMRKNWKTQAAEWAEHTLEFDYSKPENKDLDRQEMEDYLLTGRFFRHFGIGYDNYYPERWSPINTFFSQDLEIKNPQDGEYVGRVHYLSSSDVINRYGHLITAREQQELTGYYDESLTEGSPNTTEPTFEKVLDKHFVQNNLVPDANHFEREMGYEMEETFDVPMGEQLYYNPETGETESQRTWLPKKNTLNYLGNQYVNYLRDDIKIRTDLIQVTEAYWRGYERIGLLTYETEEGIIDQEIVTDDILNEFLKENGIKKVQTTTLAEIESATKKGDLSEHVNTIVYTYIPQIWKGVKINRGNSYLKKDLYLEVAPLEYQIKGDSEVYDLKLPVAGIIGSSMAQKIRPFQIGYNYCMNQIYNLLEKEIGMFFLFDVNYLPSEFKDQGDSADWMLELRNMAHEVGIVPIDSKKQNTQNAQQFNTFMAQNITYDTQIKSRLELAEQYKRQAFEQIGVTAQMLGAPSQYSTAEGIKKADVASFAQLERYFADMRTSKLRTLELHLAVAQYAQSNDKDTSIFYASSEGEQLYRKFDDPNFPLRRLRVLPTADSKTRKEVEAIKNYVLSNNTMDNSLENFAQIIAADTNQELISIGRRAEQKKQQDLQAERQHQQQMLDKQIQAQAQEKQSDREWEEMSKQRDRENKLNIEQIEALGRAADNDSSTEDMEYLRKITQDSINAEQRQQEISVKQEKLDLEKNKEKANLDLKRDQMRLEMMKLKQKDKELDTKRFTSIINKN